MIIDTIENLDKYEKLIPNIATAIKKMKSMKSWHAGTKYSFDGGYVFFQEGATKPLEEANFEAHKKYIDVQIVLKGHEYVAWNDLKELTEIIPYDAEKDVQKFTGENSHMMKFSKGMAYICFPWDGHKAVFHTDEPLHYTKAVIKLASN